MTLQVNASLREGGGKRRIKKNNLPIKNLLQTARRNPTQKSERREKNQPLKVGGHNVQTKEELTVLPQCAQKSGTPEVFSCFLNMFVAKPTFCVEEPQLKPQHSKMWYLHYHVWIGIIRAPGLKRRRMLLWTSETVAAGKTTIFICLWWGNM